MEGDEFVDDKWYMNENGDAVKWRGSLLDWAKWFGKANRRIARTESVKGTVSTVFLGSDHSFGYGPPLLYETLVFGGPLDGEMRQYSTRERAIEGHMNMVEKVKEGVK